LSGNVFVQNFTEPSAAVHELSSSSSIVYFRNKPIYEIEQERQRQQTQYTYRVLLKTHTNHKNSLNCAIILF